jgi:hypothetical protein
VSDVLLTRKRILLVLILVSVGEARDVREEPDFMTLWPCTLSVDGVDKEIRGVGVEFS